MRSLIIIITIATLIGCSDEPCDIPLILPEVPNEEIYQENINTIQQYLADNNLVANSTNSGLHYIIEDPGSESKPDLCDEVTLAYSGMLPNGFVFDASPEIEFPLIGFIRGWWEGIPLFGKGGKGTLLIPSYLAYGDQSPGGGIPANSVLIFNIELKDF